MIKLRKGEDDSIVLNPQSGNIHVGGPSGAAGNILVLPENSSEACIHLDGRGSVVSVGEPIISVGPGQEYGYQSS